MNALLSFTTGLIRRTNVNTRNQFTQYIRVELLYTHILMDVLYELLDVTHRFFLNFYFMLNVA